MTEELTTAIVDLRERDALAIADRLLAGGVDPVVLLDAAKQAMDVIGARFAAGEAFIPELIMAGEIMQQISGRLKPLLGGDTPAARRGTVVLGTVQGDIHDIGKDIVAAMLDLAGFEVVDLGVDVSAEQFVTTVRDRRAGILAMSSLLTVAIEAMKNTVAALDQAGLRDAVRVMVGGAPITDQVRDYTGADGCGKDAVAAVELAKRWTGGA